MEHFLNGTAVCTVRLADLDQHPEIERRNWTAQALVERRWGVLGTIEKHSRGHGLCYKVNHVDGTSGWYDHAELQVLAVQTLDDECIRVALDQAHDGSIDGEHHKTWVIDQMVRILTGCEDKEVEAIDYKGKKYTYMTLGESEKYLKWVADHCEGEDGPNTYSWDEGRIP